jgi:hypothetical protein
MDEVQDPTLSEEIDRLHSEHRRYAQRLEELLQKPYLSEDEQLEEVRLKKLKLHAKDLIFALERRRQRSLRAPGQLAFAGNYGAVGPLRMVAGSCVCPGGAPGPGIGVELWILGPLREWRITV